MRRRLALLSLIGLSLLHAPAPAQGARPDDFKLSISVEQATFNWSRAKVRGRVENKSGRTINAAELGVVHFNFRRYGADTCTGGMCYVADFPVKLKKSLKDGESVELEADLGELYWKDMISSIHDLDEPRNLRTAVGPGSYYLFMSLQLPAGRNADGVPLTHTISSNKLFVTFRTSSLFPSRDNYNLDKADPELSSFKRLR